MKDLFSFLVLSALGAILVGCGAGEQEAPKPNPAQFAPKPGGPDSGGPNSAPVTSAKP